MRIAILTLPLHTNFGGILQCYALQTVLQSMGHEVSVLNTAFDKVDCKTRIGLFIKRLIKTMLRRESKFYGWKTEREITRKNTLSFISKHINIRNVADLSLLNEDEFDAIVVGSDQIWRPCYYHEPIANAYLKFAKDWTRVNRVAYAASFGTDSWEYTQQQTEECAALLKLFSAVSVRERSGINLCEKYFGKHAVQTLDPTLLLTKECYQSLVSQSSAERHDGGLCYYFLDATPEKLQLAQKVAMDKKMVAYWGNNPNVEKYHLYFEERIQISVEQWLANLMDASLVVTDSFHGCVFSILFNKPFLAIGNKERGLDRFISLLSQFGLEHNLLTSCNDEVSISESHFDWNDINRKLQALRETSMMFLKTSL